MTTVHATNGPPLGWASHRFTHCLSTVFPNIESIPRLTSESSGRLLPRRRFRSAKTEEPETLRRSLQKVDSAKDILYQQRQSIKIYTGHRWPFNRSVKDITNRLSQSGPRRQAPEPMDELPSLEQTTDSISRPKYSTQDVQDIVDRLSTYDPEKIPESKGYQIKLESPILYKRKYTKLEIQDIVDRLTEFDPDKFPAESKGISPVVLHEIPRQTLSRPRKCTAREIQDLVDRLCAKDPNKWPEGKRYRIVNAFNTVLSERKEQARA